MRAALLGALLGLSALLSGSAVAAIPGEKAPAAATASAVPTAAEQLEMEREARREAEHKAAIAEAKAELMDAGNSRMEVMIGMFGILITTILAVGAFFTWKSAANAARGELLDMRESIKEIEKEVTAAKTKVDGLTSEIGDMHLGAAETVNKINMIASQTPGQSNMPPLTADDSKILEQQTKEFAQTPRTQWSAQQFRLAMLKAEQDEDWTGYLELAKQMESQHADNQEDRAHAQFAIGYGHTELRQYEEAGEAYGHYLAQCPNDDLEQRAWALNNWGSALDMQARAKAGSDPDEADRLWALAGEKYHDALALKPDKHDAFYNWGNALTTQAGVKVGSDPNEAGKLWALAGEKYRDALAIKPDMHEALHNWGSALFSQAYTKAGEKRDELLAHAEEKLTRANSLAPGHASYNLACMAGLCGNASQAADWLRDAKTNDVNFPNCDHIASDADFDSIRDTPEFQQALIDIGCAPPKPKRTPRKSRAKP